MSDVVPGVSSPVAVYDHSDLTWDDDSASPACPQALWTATYRYARRATYGDRAPGRTISRGRRSVLSDPESTIRGV